MPVAQIAPKDFVDELIDPGLMIFGMPGFVQLRRYLCAVGEYGGNTKATQLMLAIRSVTKGTPEEATIHDIGATEFARLFTGQGKKRNFREVMRLIWDNREAFKAYKDGAGKTILAKYFDAANPIQAMVDDSMFGLDCIGFVGRYVEAAGIFTTYPTLYPRQYLDRFFPITSITEIDDLCVLVWVHGQHIAIIDSITEVNTTARPAYAVVTICQSSAGGPQTNDHLILRSLSTSEYLKFGEYGKAVDGKPVSEADKAGLRKSLLEVGTTGYRGGMFFDVQLGRPPAPVKGHVYVGKLPDLTKAWDPIIELG